MYAEAYQKTRIYCQSADLFTDPLSQICVRVFCCHTLPMHSGQSGCQLQTGSEWVDIAVFVEMNNALKLNFRCIFSACNSKMVTCAPKVTRQWHILGPWTKRWNGHFHPKMQQFVCRLITRHPLKHSQKVVLWGKWSLNGKFHNSFLKGLMTRPIHVFYPNLTQIGHWELAFQWPCLPDKKVILGHFHCTWPRMCKVSRASSHLSPRHYVKFRPDWFDRLISDNHDICTSCAKLASAYDQGYLQLDQGGNELAASAVQIQLVPPENCKIVQCNFDKFVNLRNFWHNTQFLCNFPELSAHFVFKKIHHNFPAFSRCLIWKTNRVPIECEDNN